MASKPSMTCALAALVGVFAACSQLEAPAGRGADAGRLDARPTPPGARGTCGEICGNGVDDNGDGRADECCACLPGASQRCYRGPLATRGVGTCRDGVQQCTGVSGGELGTWGPCEGGVVPAAEQCDGMDHDCNGARNDGADCRCTPGETQRCGGGEPGVEPRLPCRAGTVTCGANGHWGPCEGTITPSPDVCGDGVDNDCNGAIDDGCGTPDGGAPPPDGAAPPPDAAATPDGAAPDDVTVPSAMCGLRQVVQSFPTECVLTVTGRVACMGQNIRGALGAGSTDQTLRYTEPRWVPELTDIVQLAAGSALCALHASGVVDCWGQNSEGAIGDGTVTADFRPAPTRVVGVTDAIQIAVGTWHACALRRGGEVTCWGDDRLGQIGTGRAGGFSCTPLNEPRPRAVVGLSDAVQIAAGSSHTCARRRGGQIVCWGDAGWSELGDGGPSLVPGCVTTGVPRVSTSPVPVAGIADAVDLTTGGSATAVTRASGGAVWWGLGTGAAVPTAVPVGADVAGLAIGQSTWCVLRRAGTVQCWGMQNGLCQLGDGGPRVEREVAAPGGDVAALRDVVSLHAAPNYTVAIRRDTCAWRWGMNPFAHDGDTPPPVWGYCAPVAGPFAPAP